MPIYGAATLLSSIPKTSANENASSTPCWTRPNCLIMNCPPDESPQTSKTLTNNLAAPFGNRYLTIISSPTLLRKRLSNQPICHGCQTRPVCRLCRSMLQPPCGAEIQERTPLIHQPSGSKHCYAASISGTSLVMNPNQYKSTTYQFDSKSTDARNTLTLRFAIILSPHHSELSLLRLVIELPHY